MKTTESNITTGMTPVEAANLLVSLQQGHQAAWRSTRETRSQSSEYETRFQTAAEIDGVLGDAMWETVVNGMRRAGEPVEQFAERAESEAKLADARKAGTEATADAVTRQADPGTVPERTRDSQDEIAASLLTDPTTPEGQAYARALSDTAATYVRQMRERDPLPEPDRTPGAAHPDPFLAARGWHVNEHGIYSRTPEPQVAPRTEKELEAG